MILVSVFWVVDDLDYPTWQIVREINSLAKMQQEKQKTLTICQLANQRLKCNAKVGKDHLRTLCKLTINNKVWLAKNQGITKDLLMVADWNQAQEQHLNQTINQIKINFRRLHFWTDLKKGHTDCFLKTQPKVLSTSKNIRLPKIYLKKIIKAVSN